MHHRTSYRRVNRRSFLQQAAVGTGAIAGFSHHSIANESLPASDRLSAAVIGTGGIARFHAAHQFKPYFEIKAICDVDRASASFYNKTFAKDQAFVCSDYQQLLDREDIDVFFVCTPDHWHTKITVDALRNGKDVYCEKPLTLTIAEGRRIRDALSETDRILQVGTQQRSDPNFQTAVALARSGMIGKVKQITVAIGGGPVGGPFATEQPPAELDWNQWLGQAPMTEYIPQRCHGNFRWWYEYSGGKMTDWGAHHVDIAQWALEPEIKGPISIELVNAKHPVPFENGMPTVTDSYNTATSFRVDCKLANGSEIVIRDNAVDLGFENGVLFECEDGRYFVNRGKLTGKPVEQLSDSPQMSDLRDSLRKGRDVMNHFANFYWSCRERTESMSDAASHIRSLDICHLANIAMRLGRGVKWDPAAECILEDDEAAKWQSRRQREGFETV